MFSHVAIMPFLLVTPGIKQYLFGSKSITQHQQEVCILWVVVEKDADGNFPWENA